MAAFTDADMSGLDYRLFQNTPVSLCYSTTVFEEHVAGLEALGYRCPRFDCDRWATEDDLYDDFSRRLDFPSYFGRNLDALNDCLWDLPTTGRTGIVLVFPRYDRVVTRLSRVAWHVLDIIAQNSRYYLLRGERLFALLQSNDPRLRFEPVGATPVMWNFREWFNASRGV